MKRVLFFAGVFLLTACSRAEIAPPVSPAPPEVPVLESLPLAVNLSVPFFSQAPDADWSLPWQETCEEATAVLAHAYATGRALTKNEFRQELLKIVSWEKERFGFYDHTTVAQTAAILRDFYGFTGFEIIDDPFIDQLKYELAQGRVLLAPMAGQWLVNPYYKPPGPVYHMLLVKGYDAENFITHDVGTARGADFYYTYNIFLNALHDWHDEDILKGARRVLAVTPSSQNSDEPKTAAGRGQPGQRVGDKNR